jgi:hypothetical protein
VLVLVFIGAVTVTGTVPEKTVWGSGVLLKISTLLGVARVGYLHCRSGRDDRQRGSCDIGWVCGLEYYDRRGAGCNGSGEGPIWSIPLPQGALLSNCTIPSHSWWISSRQCRCRCSRNFSLSDTIHLDRRGGTFSGFSYGFRRGC